ncbi:DinB family protein [Cohnella lupini]|uniref:DinB family protein n=1 Tax=Cohnella lupini TaxID=1294267 RepID=A0A3D9IYR1_9BACL|nr:DinB family protein [Cohnella lupini]RED66216.1 DinB family protein [Cohnella lupini]
MTINDRPRQEEYGTYYEQYIGLVPTGNIVEFLADVLKTTSELLSDIPEDRGNYRYAPDKWSLKEVLGHINDNERVMAYRLLRFARGDRTPLAGYDQDEFMKGVSFDSLSLTEIIEDYISVRRSTLTLLRGLSEEAWSRRGIANDNEMSVKALAYIIAGHELHHLNIVKERYIVR